MKYVNVMFVFLLLLSNSLQAQVDNCLRFDGINDYITIGDVVDLGESDFTIEAWVYIENTAGVGNKIINKGLTTVGTPSNAGYCLRASKTGADEIEFAIGNSNGNFTRVLYYGITTDTWYHVAGVRSGRLLSLYLNGELVKEEITESVYNVDTNIPLAIGVLDRGVYGVTGEFMSGKIDEVRIWNVRRSEGEIQAEKDCALTMPYPGLVAVYNLNEATGMEAGDASGNDHTGILEGNPDWISSEVAPVCIVDKTEFVAARSMKIYPNPFCSTIQLEGKFAGKTYAVFDVMGRLQFRGEVVNDAVDLSGVRSGVYWFQIKDGRECFVEKIVKQ